MLGLIAVGIDDMADQSNCKRLRIERCFKNRLSLRSCMSLIGVLTELMACIFSINYLRVSPTTAPADIDFIIVKLILCHASSSIKTLRRAEIRKITLILIR